MKAYKIKQRYYKSATCPICKCTVMVEKLAPYGPGISRLKAMADHFNCLHKETSK